MLMSVIEFCLYVNFIQTFFFSLLIILIISRTVFVNMYTVNTYYRIN